MMDPKTVGVNIAGYRKEKGMTQAELADKLGVSNKAVSKWECGRGLPDKSMFPALEELLGITREQLISEGNGNVSDNETSDVGNSHGESVKNAKKVRFRFVAILLAAVIISAILFGVFVPMLFRKSPVDYTVTLRGASFVSGGAEAVIAEGEGMPEVILDTEKTFLGWADQDNNYYTTEDFTMTSSDMVLSAVYAEDLGALYTPSCVYEDLSDGVKYAARHLYVDGYKATEFIAHETKTGNGFKILNGFVDSGGLDRPDYCDNYFPVSPKENNLIFLTFINNGDEDLELSYSIDYFGIIDTIDVSVSAGETLSVPFDYCKCKDTLPYVLTSYHRLTFRNSVREFSLVIYGRMYDPDYYDLAGNRYTLSVQGGTIGGNTSSEIQYRKTLNVELIPEREDGFIGWKTDEGKIYDTTEELVSYFRMPAHAVTVKAVYADEMTTYMPSCVYKDKSKKDSDKLHGEHTLDGTKYVMDASVENWVIYNGADEIHDIPDDCPSSTAEERFYLMTFSCKSDSDLTLLVGPEYYGMKCCKTVEIPANGSVSVIMHISGFTYSVPFWQITNKSVREGSFELTVSGRYA